VALDDYAIDPAQPGGPRFAADRDGNGVLWPFGKVVYGVEGAFVRVSPQTPMPVTITAGNPDTGQALGGYISAWNSEADTPAERVLAADDNRLSITVQNFGSNEVWLGDAAAAAGLGVRLLPGQGIIIDRAPRGELWAFAVGPTDVGGIVEALVEPSA
jgi:hypothetical protein